jgi:hypothetical protein
MNPTEERSQEFQVRFSHTGSMCNGARLTTISQNQVNVILKVTNVLPRSIDSRVKLKSSGIKGCILRDLFEKEFIIQGRRVPDSIRGQNDVRKLLQFFISRRLHIHVGKSRAVGERDVVPFRK